MSNKNNKVSLSDRINNPDRMSRAMNVLLTNPTIEDNVIVNDNVLEKPLTKPLINIESNIIEKDIVIDMSKDNINDITNTKSKTITKSNVESLATTINCMIREIERLQAEELSPLSLIEDPSKKKDKVKFDDKNPIISFPARPEIEKIISLIYEKTGVKKYKIFEMLIMNGLRNTKF